MLFKHFDHDEIHQIHSAAVTLGLASSRKTLLGSLAPGFVEGLPIKSNPSEQLVSDLQEMNLIAHLDDPEQTIPLQRWLSTAVQLTSTRTESRVLKNALAKLAGAAPPARAAGGSREPGHATALLHWGPTLSGADFEEIQEALLSAFPSREALGQMLRFGLDKRLDEIAGHGNQRDTTYALLTKAEAEGWVGELFGAALARVPRNPALLAIAAKRRA